MVATPLFDFDPVGRNRPGRPQPTQEQRDRLRDFLRTHTWVTQNRISAVTGLPGRIVREIATTCDGDILGNVSLGYCLTENATREEITHAIQSLDSRARQISRRASDTRKRALQLGKFDD